MKKTMYIMIFLMTMLISSIYNVKALNNPVITNGFLFPSEWDINNVAAKYRNNTGSLSYKLQCWHTNSSSSEVYCFVGNISFNSWLVWNNGSYSNIYNSDGFGSSDYNWYWSNTGFTYRSMAIYKWNNDDYTWSTICESVTNVCDNHYIVSNGNQFPISFITYNSDELNSPMFRTDIIYTKQEWISPYYNLINPRELTVKKLYIYNVAPSGSAYDRLDVIVYTDDEDLIGTVAGNLYYSYDNSTWYNVGEVEWVSEYFLNVYSNETVYFKVVDSDDNVILSNSFTVTGKVTFNGYQTINIPSGNHNVYISNFSNSFGSFYIPPDYKIFTSEFVYLDSNGNKVGNQYINTSNYDDIGVDTISGDSYFMLKVPYDYSSFTNVNTLMFNVDSQYDLTLYIPTGLYIDVVNLNVNGNFDCSSSSDIVNGVNYSNCELGYKQMVDNSLISGTDSTTTKYIEEDNDVNNSDNFTITFKNMFLQFSKPFYIIGNLYTNFIGVIPVPIMYSIYLGFGLLILCVFIKIWL